jgi:peptidoglycan/LPS O-acetylase OafA/YrhL
MNTTPEYLHVILNHFPLVGFMAAVIPLLYALVRREKHTLRIAFIMIIVFGLCMPVVMITGLQAQQRFEQEALAAHLDDAGLAWIYEHGERAKKTAVAVYITAGVALAGVILGFKSFKLQYLAGVICLICIIVCLALMAWTAKAGGKIRHTEFRSPPQQVVE